MAAAHLESLQIRILERIQCLEDSLQGEGSRPQEAPPRDAQPLSRDGEAEDSSTEHRLGRILESVGVYSFEFKRVPSDYYDRSFEERRDLLGAASIDHLCKSIVMVRASQNPLIHIIPISTFYTCITYICVCVCVCICILVYNRIYTICF